MRRWRGSSSTIRRRDSLGPSVLLISRGLDPVCGAHAQWGEHDPGNQPEQIEGQAKDHWVNAIPERHRKAHRREGYSPKQDGAGRWLSHDHRTSIRRAPPEAALAGRRRECKCEDLGLEVLMSLPCQRLLLVVRPV